MELETQNTKYTLVFRIFPRKVFVKSLYGFTHTGYKCGMLVKSNRYGCDVRYHKFEECLGWLDSIK